MNALPDMPLDAAPRRKGALAWARVGYGVDVQGDTPVVVRAERARAGVRCLGVWADDASFRADLAMGRPAVCCLSVRESFARWLEVPLASIRKARKVLSTVLDIQLPFALEDCVHEFVVVLPTPRGTVRALAVVARRGDVEKKLERLAGQGIDPCVLDHEGLALWSQSVKEIPCRAGQGGCSRALVCMAPDHWTLVLGAGPWFGGSHAVRPGDMAQISRLLRAELRSGKGDGDSNAGGEEMLWVWTGAGASDAAAVAGYHDQVGKEWPGSCLRHDDPGSFLARALATRALVPGAFRCNVRSGDLAHPVMVDRARRGAGRLALGALLAGLALCVSNAAVKTVAARKEAAVDRAFAALRDDLLGYPLDVKGERALRAVRTKVESDAELLRPFLDAVGPSLLPEIWAIADTAGRAGLRIEVLSLGRREVMIAGTARDWNACEVLVGRLQQAGRHVKLVRKTALDDGRIPFTISSGGHHG